jgi:hypothetical protein
MEGVTTAIVLFIFVGVTFPSLIKIKAQFYASLAAIVLVIFLDASARVIHSDAYIAFAYFMNAMLQVCAIVLLVLSAGGMTFSEFKSELTEAADAIRQGEDPKEIIIPLSATDKAKIAAARQKQAQKVQAQKDEAPQVFKIDDPAPTPPPKPGPERKSDPSGPLPLA